MSFWDRFGPDYRRNCMAWRHSPANPVIPPVGDGWKSRWTANPDVLEHDGRRLLYYRGNGVLGDDPALHDRIGVAEIVELTGESITLRDLGDGPAVDVGAPGAFDSQDVLDPAAVRFRGATWLYYSAVGDGPDSVGLAVSADGVHFEKRGKVLTGRAPDVVVRHGRIYMLFQEKAANGRYDFRLAVSEDGQRFEPAVAGPVLEPAGESGWDSYDINTGRLIDTGDGYLLIYGGSSSLLDQPDYFGLARSTDLIHWERHPGNPIFGCGPKGAEDGGAIWFPALVQTDDAYVLLYEGSRGNYRSDLSSQICMASIDRA